MYAVGVLFGWLADEVDGLATPALARLRRALTAAAPGDRPGALAAQQDPFFTTEEAARRAQLDLEQAAFAESVAAMAETQRRHAEAAAALSQRQAALIGEQSQLAHERSSLEGLRASSAREDVEVRRRVAAAADAERGLRAETASVAAAAHAAEQLRQKLEADRRKIVRQHPPAPGHWEHKDLSKVVFKLVDTSFMVPKLQALLRDTPLGACGGCGASLARAMVMRVCRIENTVLWKNFGHRKATMLELSRGSRPQRVQVPLHASLDLDANEVFLFHGTDPQLAKVIAKHRFDERMANLSGLYGGGSYFAENSCKSNQYARTPTAAGEHAIMYCRVAMGDAFRTSSQLKNRRRAPDKPGGGGGTFDSVLASGGAQVHREFIVYDRNQVYPEFIVYYTRWAKLDSTRRTTSWFHGAPRNHRPALREPYVSESPLATSPAMSMPTTAAAMTSISQQDGATGSAARPRPSLMPPLPTSTWCVSAHMGIKYTLLVHVSSRTTASPF